MSREPREAPKSDLRQIGIRVPEALSGRLDGLLALADEAGVRTSRRELVAALLHDAFRRERELVELVRHYRTTPVAEAFLSGERGVRFQHPLRTPGPRRSAVASRRPAEALGRAADEDQGNRRLSHSPTVRIALDLPAALLDELGRVVVRLEEERATRTEVIAALILAAPEAGEELAGLTRSFRSRSALRRKARAVKKPVPRESTPPGRRVTSEKRSRRARR